MSCHQNQEARVIPVVHIDRNWRIRFINDLAELAEGPVAGFSGPQAWDFFALSNEGKSQHHENSEQAQDAELSDDFEVIYPGSLHGCLRIQVKPTSDGIAILLHENDQEDARTNIIQREKLDAVRRLAASMAHGINNPLEALMNLLYLARESSDISAIHHMLATADEELRRLTVIANQSLKFHKQSSSPQELCCVDLFTSALFMFKAKLRNCNIVVEERRRALGVITLYEADIQQMLRHLISNAVDAMPTGGRLLLRSQEGRCHDSDVEGLWLTIADDGTGIPPEIRSRIREAFFSTKAIGGTGLGLWLCDEILCRYKGRMYVRSCRPEWRRGTVVRLFLPFAGA